MCRWVWDAQTNTGVIREIWHAENVDHVTIEVPDGYGTYLMLREELSQYLTANGVFRDVLHYVDLLTAQVYADYIGEQGGTYLRTDFSSARGSGAAHAAAARARRRQGAGPHPAEGARRRGVRRREREAARLSGAHRCRSTKNR